MLACFKFVVACSQLYKLLHGPQNTSWSWRCHVPEAGSAGAHASTLIPSSPAAGAVKLAHDVVMFLGPFLLEQLLRHLQTQGPGELAL